jgi:hypothetical protein
MVIRLIIDFVECRMELGDDSKWPNRLAEQPTVMTIRPNRFITQDFVFRCKVVRCRSIH